MKQKTKTSQDTTRNGEDEAVSRHVDSISGHKRKLSPVPDFWTSFARHIWSGSNLFADYLTSDYYPVDGRSTCESESEMIIPSLVALTRNSSSSPIDFSVNYIEAISQNGDTAGGSSGKVLPVQHVVEDETCSSVDNGQKGAPQLMSIAENDELVEALHEDPCFCMDLDFLSDCLGMDNAIDYDLSKSFKGPAQHRSTSGSTSSGKDDTVGHFEGGPGTVIANRYRITGDVGMGTFGRVVECLDLQENPKTLDRSSKQDDQHEKRKVAIKIVRNVKKYYSNAVSEADIIKDVNGRGGRGMSHCVILHNAYAFSGHFCLVFECMGPSLYDFMKKHDYQPFPMACIRHYCRQLLQAMDFLHSFNLIHTDLKPENILLTNCRERPYKWRGRTYQIPESTKIKVIDFGGATYDDEDKSSVVNTRQYRAPEVILGVGWSKQIDLWSVGCILAELYTGELLFATHDNIEHCALIERIVGGFPSKLLQRAKNTPIAEKAFDSSGRHKLAEVLEEKSIAYVQERQPLEKLIREQDKALRLLLQRLLVIDPDERASASELVRYSI